MFVEIGLQRRTAQPRPILGGICIMSYQMSVARTTYYQFYA